MNFSKNLTYSTYSTIYASAFTKVGVEAASKIARMTRRNRAPQARVRYESGVMVPLGGKIHTWARELFKNNIKLLHSLREWMDDLEGGTGQRRHEVGQAQ